MLVVVIVVPGVNASATKGPVSSEDDFLMNILWERYQTLPEKHDLKVGIVLGGGGARGMAHIGVFKVLSEENIPVDIITGTSVGALIGALYAAGLPADKLAELSQVVGWHLLTNYSRFSLMRLLVTERALSNENMEAYLQKYMGDIRFDQLKIPFGCVATDLQTGEKVVFVEGPVALAARASATIPGLFEPVLFRHRYLIDGGLVSNIPTDLAQLLGAKIIIAVDVTADFSKFQPKSILGILNQAIYIQSQSMSNDELARADIVIRPQLGDVGAMDIYRSQECIDAGIAATRRAIPGIKKLLIDRNFDYILGKKSL